VGATRSRDHPRAPNGMKMLAEPTAIWRRLVNVVKVVFRRTTVEDELDEELRFHLEMQIQENIRGGMVRPAARGAAYEAFGGLDRIKEECRDARGGRQIETLIQDGRFALRTLRAHPGFTFVAVVTLGLGIGANSAVFSLINGVLLRPLPYHEGHRLVHVLQRSGRAHPTGETSSQSRRRFDALDDDQGFSPLEIADYRQQTRSFTGLVEYHAMTFHLLGHGDPQRVQTAVVSDNFFDVLGLHPMMGRTFRRGEEAIGADPVLVLSYRFWERALGADPTIVGRKFTMNDRIHTVVGVLPPAPLAYPNQDDVYMPVSSCPFRSAPHWRESRSARGMELIGRLRDGVSLEKATADLETVANRLRSNYPAAYPRSEGMHLETIDLKEEMTREARSTFLILVGVVAFVLLIACANVTNLTLARMIRRDRELALRTALGAGRGRLIRQLLTESSVLALLGGAVGLIVASAGLDMLVAFAGRFTPRAHEISIDRSVLAFTFGISLLAGLLFGTLPAMSRQNLVAALKDGGCRSVSGFGGRRARMALIVGQLAVSFMLLIGAGLMLRSLLRLHHVDPGFNPENVLTAHIDLNWSKYERDRSILNFSEPLLEKVRALPGVTSAALANTFPLNDTTPFNRTFRIRGRPTPEGLPEPRADLRRATAGYFKTVGIRTIRGRTHDDVEGYSDQPVVVINQSLARRFWPGQDPIGQQLTVDRGESWFTIIGVVSDVRQYGLDQVPADEAYIPWAPTPFRDMRLLIRTQGDPTWLTPLIREIVHGIDPAQPVTDIQPLQQFRREALASPRLTAMLVAAFAGLALVITIAGLVGVIGYSVSQRTQEFGIRIALGATPSTVLCMVVRQGMVLVLVGLALGIGGSFFFTRVLSGLLFEIEPTDPLTFFSVSIVLLTVAVVACLVPARRATLVQPMVTLRAT